MQISSLIKDPYVRAAFQKAERDAGQTGLPVMSPTPKPLSGGAKARTEETCAA